MGNWFTDLFSGNKESATARLARKQGANANDLELAIAAIQDAAIESARARGIVFVEGGVKKIRAAIRESIDTSKTTPQSLAQFKAEILAAFNGAQAQQPMMPQGYYPPQPYYAPPPQGYYPPPGYAQPQYYPQPQQPYYPQPGYPPQPYPPQPPYPPQQQAPQPPQPPTPPAPGGEDDEDI